MLTPQQIDSFWSRGYLKLDQLLTLPEVEVLKERLDDVLNGRVEWPKSCFQILDPNKYRSPTGDVMPEGIQGPARQDERFQAIAEHPRLIEVMKDLMGPDVKRYTDQVIMKSPGISPATFFHQDGFYWKNTPEKTVNCWIALDDAEVGNGCLCFMPESHKLGLKEHESYFDEPSIHSGQTGEAFKRLRIPLDQIDFSKDVAEPVKPGGCLLIQKYCWHRSDPNRSSLRRRAYAIAYHEA
jgi:hypothetical protein